MSVGAAAAYEERSIAKPNYVAVKLSFPCGKGWEFVQSGGKGCPHRLKLTLSVLDNVNPPKTQHLLHNAIESSAAALALPFGI